ncbi:MAG: hypothetical protein OEZ13_05400 [Spirochaetia bacterium]|nr:hypothetical protein [Spirochaetia bacterium]
MRYSWKYIKGRGGDYPELYFLDSQKKEQIQIEVNRIKGLVKIFIDTLEGEDSFYCVISNGVIIRERDFKTGKNRNLEKEFAQRHIEISSLPDNEVLRVIGGNYGILTQFLGKAERKIQPDLDELNNFFQKILSHPKKLLTTILNIFNFLYKSCLERPKLSDVLDAALAVSLGFAIYNINFNFLHTSLAAFSCSLFSGYADWLFRKKEPYLLKIILITVPSFVLFYLGISYH